MLNKIKVNYKPKGSELYTKLVRQLYDILITSEEGIRQYEKDFRKVNAKINDLDATLTILEPYFI